MMSATITRPSLDTAESKLVLGTDPPHIERLADAWGALRIQFSDGEVWRKLSGEWIVMCNVNN